ncbi:MAG: hypothetical protein U1E60_06655 [Reyranellaceae bacterium]
MIVTTASRTGRAPLMPPLHADAAKLVDHSPEALRAEVQLETVDPDIDAGHEQLHDPRLLCPEQLLPEGIEPLQRLADRCLGKALDFRPSGAPSRDDDLGRAQ